jgi:hypothetical protein
MTTGRYAAKIALWPMLFLGAGHYLAAQITLRSKADYIRYVDPILALRNFGIQYAEDGAADATVLFPPDDQPRDPILAVVRLGPKGVPLLIDCLTDGRVTAIRFNGRMLAKPMNVPLGYVCLDILIGITRSGVVHETDCADDGLGACIHEGFYFRPDDYSRCWPDRCLARPWVRTVQRNWRRLFLQKRVRFEDPYR